MTTEEIIASAKHTNGDYYIGAVVPNAMLAIPMPEGIDPTGHDKYITTPAEYEEDGTETTPAVYAQKTLGEYFLFRWDCLDGEHTLALLKPAACPTRRKTKQETTELTMLIEWAVSLGLSMDDFIVGIDTVKAAKKAYCEAQSEESEEVL